MPSEPARRSKLFNFASRPSQSYSQGGGASSTLRPIHTGIRRPSTSNSLLQPLAHSPASSPTHGHTSSIYRDRERAGSPAFSDQMSSNYHNGPQEIVTYRNDDDLVPPVAPFIPGEQSGLSSRRSSVSFAGLAGDQKDSLRDGNMAGNQRPSSLSLNYVPAKFTKLHSQGDWAHRRAKLGGGRDAFAKDAQRMGMPGTVDDDEGVVFQLGKGGLKKKTPKLRWNRFKWVLFIATSVLIIYGMATLVSAILVWLNVFYRSDVIRVGNRTELILSTIAAILCTLTALIGYAGILLNNRAFLAVYTLMLWVCLGFIVAPGYMTYKQRTFNLEGKINAQWSRELGTEGRLRIQDALTCCGYFSPYVEATVSPLCYSRSILQGCKSKYLHLERHVLEIWYAISFGLVPAHILIILASLLCSNHITYRFGKGLTPKRYRLDLGSMAVIMDEYASQIAAQYGHSLAAEAMNKSSSNLAYPEVEYDNNSLSVPGSRRGSSTAIASGVAPPYTSATSRFPAASTGYNSAAAPAFPRGSALYDPRRDSFDTASQRRDSGEGSVTGRYFDNDGVARGNESVVSFSSNEGQGRSRR